MRRIRHCDVFQEIAGRPYRRDRWSTEREFASGKGSGRRELDMNDSSRPVSQSLGRRVYRQWPHAYDAARIGYAIDRRDGECQLLDLFVPEDAVHVSARQHAQRSVVSIRILKMDAERDHPLECCGRRDRMEYAALDRPRSPTWRVCPALYWKRRVLMPRHEPIRDGRFIEQRGAKRERLRTDVSARNLHERRMVRQRPYRWDGEDVPSACSRANQVRRVERGEHFEHQMTGKNSV